MSDGAAILRLIEATPDDDAPRLIYADWLDEQGDSERAEFIRLECEVSRLQIWTKAKREKSDRAAELWHKNDSNWLGPLAHCKGQWDFGRGFAEHLTWSGQPKELCDYLKQLSQYDAATGNTDIPPGVFLRSITVHYPSPEFARVVSEWSRAACLRCLKFIGMSNEQRGIGVAGITELISSPSLVNLEQLHLDFNFLSGHEMIALIHADNLRSLRRLNVCGNHVPSLALAQLAHNKPWPNLRALDLYNTQSSLSGFTPENLAGHGLQALTWLNIGGNDTQDATIRQTAFEALASSPVATQLQYLDCSDNQIHDNTIRTFAQGRWDNLEHLDLSRNSITDRGVQFMIESTTLKGLRKLILRGNPISAAGAVQLAKRFPREVLRI